MPLTGYDYSKQNCLDHALSFERFTVLGGNDFYILIKFRNSAKQICVSNPMSRLFKALSTHCPFYGHNTYAIYADRLRFSFSIEIAYFVSGAEMK